MIFNLLETQEVEFCCMSMIMVCMHVCLGQCVFVYVCVSIVCQPNINRQAVRGRGAEA